MQYNHTFIHPSPFAEACLLVSSSLIRSARGEPPWGAEPRIELWHALQQADTLPTELRRTLKYFPFTPSELTQNISEDKTC